MKNLKCFFILLMTLQAQAYTPKEGNVSAILGPFFHKTLYDGTSDRPKSPVLGGVGLVALGDVNDYGSLEIAMIHTNKAFFRDEEGDFLVEQTQLMHISMGYRYWQTHYFSWGVAFYSAYPMNEPKVINSSIAPGHELKTSASENVRYGIDLSLQGELWSKDRIAIVLEGRYSYPISKMVNEHSEDYGFLLGLRYFIQEKQVVPKPKEEDAT